MQGGRNRVAAGGTKPGETKRYKGKDRREECNERKKGLKDGWR